MVSPFHYCWKLFRFKKIATPNSSQLVAFIHNNQLFPKPISSITVSPPFSKKKLEESSKTNISNSSNKNKNNSSLDFTVSYLINSCGLSPESAKSASKKVNFKTPQKPDSVLEILKSHGFDRTQISNFVRRRPPLLLADPQRTLLPKIVFFNSIGVSKVNLARVLSSNPSILASSLENCIIPYYNFLKGVFVDDKLVAAVMKLPTRIGGLNYITDNVLHLKETTVPQSHIVLALTNFPEVIMQKRDKFRKTVSKVKEFGFDPFKSTFMFAIRALSGRNSRLIWERSCKVYTKWGWSEDDILSAFKKHPHCMILSEEKIEKAMDFFVNKMGFEPNVIAQSPTVFLYSLEKRIIPRCSVMLALSLNGLVKKMTLTSILIPSEKDFLERFVIRNKNQLPLLMSIYEAKMGISAL